MKHYFISLSLISLVLLSLGIAYFLSTTYNTSKPSMTNTVDTYMTHITYRSFNSEGKLSSTLKAKNSNYIKSNKIINFSQPNITLYPQDQAPWQISALTGQSNDTYSEIKLSKNVIFKRSEPDDSKNPAILITTETATLHLKTKQVTSNKHVTIKQGASVIEGDGLVADLRTGNYTLLSNTQGHYTPTPPNPE